MGHPQPSVQSTQEPASLSVHMQTRDRRLPRRFFYSVYQRCVHSPATFVGTSKPWAVWVQTLGTRLSTPQCPLWVLRLCLGLWPVVRPGMSGWWSAPRETEQAQRCAVLVVGVWWVPGRGGRGPGRGPVPSELARLLEWCTLCHTLHWICLQQDLPCPSSERGGLLLLQEALLSPVGWRRRPWHRHDAGCPGPTILICLPLQGRRFIYAGSNSGVVQAPVAFCGKHSTCEDCVLARDPHCAWSPATAACVALHQADSPSRYPAGEAGAPPSPPHEEHVRTLCPCFAGL